MDHGKVTALLPGGMISPGEGALRVTLMRHTCDKYCHKPGFCESCGTPGTDVMLYIGTTADGLLIICCEDCLAKEGLEIQ